jgi:DNA-binding GntR family transcriptional regulator
MLDPLARDVRVGLFRGGFQGHLRTLGVHAEANEVLIQAINADSATAAALGVREGHALVYTRRVGFDAADNGIELTFTRHRSELSSFVVRSPISEAGS